MQDLKFAVPLFVPGDRPERFEKAASSGGDAVIIDLEDAVAPDRKELARSSVRDNILGLPVVLRINAASTPWHRLDLEAASRLRLSAIMFPKAELGECFRLLSELDVKIPVIALIETALGLAQAREIAALPFVARLAFGSIDYSADIGCEPTREALLSARSELVLASRLASLSAPLDGVTTRIDNAKLTEDNARYGRSLGFGGKLCIHPRQIDPVARGYRPTEEEVAWAQKVLKAGSGAIAVDGRMIDEPVRHRARSILLQIDE